MSDVVYCIKCETKKQREDIHAVFKTGFHWEDGKDYLMGVCKDCLALSSNETLEN